MRFTLRLLLRHRPAAVIAAVFAIAAVGFTAWQWTCANEYDVTVRVSATDDPAWPYKASGEIVGCGVRRLEGKSAFGLMLRPGTSSVTRATHGRAIISVEAGVAPDGATIWYVATVTRGKKTQQFQKRRVPVPLRRKQAAALPSARS